jgi:hypothetical protein
LQDFPGSDAQADAQAAALAGLVQESTEPAIETASAVYQADDHFAQQVIAAVNSSVAEVHNPLISPHKILQTTCNCAAHQTFGSVPTLVLHVNTWSLL